MATTVRARIAPSPTGNLHLGTARTALYNYLFARRHKGVFILRLEDTDELRSNEAFTRDIVEGLHWLGIQWDEGLDIGGPHPPYRQTEKIGHYADMAQKLIDAELAYHCYCTAQELTKLKEEQKNASEGPRYNNRCRDLSLEEIAAYKAAGRVPAIRFKVKQPHIVSWNDLVKGTISIETSDLGGDMVIVKSNGVATYNFAVVVDDVDMQITHVIRGEDHIHNTAKQILLYEALAKPIPEFAHAPLIFDAERRKLSKRHHGELVHMDKYRQDGYMPEAIINYLAQMSWAPADGREIFTLQEACEIFELERVSKSPAVFDVARLKWFNGNYIRTLPIALVTARALPYLESYDLTQYSKQEIEQIVSMVREGLSTLSEIKAAVNFFFEKQVTIPPDLSDSLMGKESSRQVLSETLARVGQFPWGDAKGCKAVVDTIGKDLGLKGKDLYWPVRAALQGKTSGPDLGCTVAILGQHRLQSRLEGALKLCPQAQS